MSISGTEEVKTAILQRGVVSGGEQTAELDAQEDREVVGLAISADIDPTSGVATDLGRVRTRVHIGVNQFQDLLFADLPTAAGTTADNFSFHFETHHGSMDDDVNNAGALDQKADLEWFGKGSGIEWNEDATLTILVRATASDAIVSATIYYREL